MKNRIQHLLARNIVRGDRKTLLICLFLAVVVLISGTDDRESISLYLDKLQSFSGHKISKEQKNHVVCFYVNNQNRNPLKNERRISRAKFNSSRKKLKQEWRNVYKINVDNRWKIEWHHIVPINAGGINVWWNISPISSKKHKLIHASIEEKACFSHDFFHRRFMRFVLKAQSVFFYFFKGYINKKGTNYAT